MTEVTRINEWGCSGCGRLQRGALTCEFCGAPYPVTPITNRRRAPALVVQQYIREAERGLLDLGNAISRVIKPENLGEIEKHTGRIIRALDSLRQELR